MKPVKLRLISLCFLFAFITSCERNTGNTAVTASEITKVVPAKIIELDTSITASTENLKIKLYIENSGSMFGYVNGRTELKDALQNLLVELNFVYNKNDENKIEIYFINSQIHKTPFDDLPKFADKLSPTTMKIGATGSSDLNDIFKQLTTENQDNTISILLSDFIYSIKGEDTNALLGSQQALTKNVFLNASKKAQKLTTNIYQFFSDFEGTYYDYNNVPKPLKTSRPYYFAILGKQKDVALFTENFGDKFRNYKGYTNEYLLTAEDFKIENFTVLQATLNKGSIKPIKNKYINGQIRAVEIEENTRSGEPIEFAVAVDLSKLRVTDDYKTSIANYILKDSSDFTLTAIGNIQDDEILFANGTIEQISPADLPHMGFKPTHAFAFRSKNGKIEDFNFALKRVIPNWVDNASVDDDTMLASTTKLQTKTFGLNYLISGISDAYLQATKKDQYFDITIPLQKPKATSFGGIIITMIFCALLISLIILIISKRNKRK